MRLTGPCFSMGIEIITCLFTDEEGDVTSFTDHRNLTTKRVIKGITVSEKAVCPLPLFRRLGNHNVTVILSNGTQYTGSFNVGMLVAHIRMHVALVYAGHQTLHYSPIINDLRMFWGSHVEVTLCVTQ